MQQLPTGWTPNDLARFNAALDVLGAYQQLDYVRKIVAANDPFLQARQDDLRTLALALAQTFKQQFGQD